MKKEYAMSSVQGNIYALEQYAPGAKMNYLTAAIHLDGIFDVSDAVEVLNDVVKNTEVLRTRIELNEEGLPVQYIESYIPEEYGFFDCKEMTEDEIMGLIRELADEHMELISSPLYRFFILETTNGILAVIKVHHIICDGRSLELICRKIAGDAVCDIPYSDFVSTEQQYLSSKAYGRDKRYWDRVISNPFVPAGIRSDSGSFRSERYEIEIDKDRFHSISKYCYERHISTASFMYSCFGMYMYRAHGMSDICVGVPVDMRNIDNRDAIGMYVNTMPLILHSDADMKASEYVDGVDSAWLNLLKHKRMPYAEIGDGLMFNMAISYMKADSAYSECWIAPSEIREQMVIHLTETDDSLVVTIDYRPDMFGIEEIRYILSCVNRLCSSVCFNDDELLDRLSILDDEEIKLLTHMDEVYHDYSSCCDYLLSHCREDDICCIEGDRSYTYHELLSLADRISSSLDCDETVGIRLGRGFNLLASMVGILKAGSAFMCIPDSIPRNRLNTMIESSDVSTVIDEEYISNIDVKASLGDRGSLSKSAYVIYTSGSTGTPKGVRISQINLLNLAMAVADTYPSNGSVLSICSTGFDAFMLESMVPLMNGRCIAIADAYTSENPKALGELMKSKDVTMVSMTPSRLSRYMRNDEFRTSVQGLKTIVCGGEGFPSDLYEDIRRCNRDVEIYNQYGPSETAVTAAMKKLEGAAVTCGHALSGSAIYVLDEHMDVLPRMCIGEVYISGMQVGEYIEEYMDSPFMEDPFNDGYRMYKSGDTGYVSLDGELVILGRKDNQLKIRGLRIEPDEIRNVLLGYEGIEEVHVSVKDDNIIAFHTSETDISEIVLKSYMAEYLPSYMVPLRIVRVPDIPLTDNGKVDERTLFKYIAKDNKLKLDADEEAQAEHIAEVLSLTIDREIGIYDSYFMNGGSSLSAMEAAGCIKDEYGIRIRVTDIYAAQTAASLSRLISEREAEIEEKEISDELSMTGMQKGIYFESMMDDTGLRYNMPGIFDVTGIDKDRLKSALNKLVETDPVFRLSFDDAGVHVAETVSLDIKEYDASPESVMDDFVRPFNLSIAPLVRFGICEYMKHTYLLCDMHHIIGDGLSTEEMVRRLSILYSGGTYEPQYSYLDYMREKGNGASREFWNETLEDAEPLKLRDSGTDEVSALWDISDLKSSLYDYSSNRGISTYAVLAASIMYILSRLSGEKDVVVGVPFANREDRKRIYSIGPYINTMPLKVSVSDDMDIHEYVHVVMKKILSLMDYMDESLYDILSVIDYDREKGSLINVLINESPVDESSLSIDGMDMKYIPWDTGVSKMDLEIDIIEAGGTLKLRCTGRIPEWQMNVMKECLDDILRYLPESGSLGSIPFRNTSVSEREPIYDDGKRLNDIFRKQAEMEPFSTAVIFNDREYSYGEISKAAESITQHLIDTRVSQGSAVGVRMHRSPLMMAALIGILDAGCLYVPIEPKLPEKRVAEMTELGKVSCILDDDLNISMTGYENSNEEGLFGILFTSGSTGKPKGVKLRHSSMKNLYLYMESILSSSDTVLCSTGIAFDVYMTESVISLALGKKIVLLSDDEMMDPADIAGLIDRYDIGIMQMTPSRIQALLMNDRFAAEMKSVKTVLLAGEALSSALVRRIRESLGTDGEIYNLYGPAEATVYCTYGKITGDAVTIGKASDGCIIYILDENLRPCITGEAGEICIAGRCLTSGYAGNPDLTAEKYVICPSNGERIYRSGDIGYMNGYGDIVYLGRNDDQIKLNGQRVEPSEVTGAMLCSGAVSDAYCMAVERPSGEARLIGFLVPASAYEAGPVVREYLEGVLPPYMVPDIYIELSMMPHTMTGKMDRKALKSMADEYFESHVDYTGDIDEVLLNIWREALGTYDIDPDMSFFRQGGTSIDALKVISMYFNNGYDMTLKEFYADPVLRVQNDILMGTEKRLAHHDTYEFRGGLERKEYEPDESRGILLTGATGYLGVHLLGELRRIYPHREIYVLLRSDNMDDACMYMLGERIDVIKVFGDIGLEDLGLSKREYYELSSHISQVINCAADVRHYVIDEAEMENINVGGARRLAEFAYMSDAELIQISTASLSGAADMGNAYLRTKMMAEDVLRGTPELKYRIFRIGRLAGRMSDGRFQRNRQSNAFYLLLNAIGESGAIPEIMKDIRLEITPVDWAASELASAIHMGDDDRDICYPYMYSISEVAEGLGRNIQVISNEEFEKIIKKETNKNKLQSISYLIDLYMQLRDGRGESISYTGGEPLDLSVILKEFMNE